MRINYAGLKLIKEFEGCKLTSYQDQKGIWTIGYGHTGPDVHPGLTIGQEKADSLLSDDLYMFENDVANAVIEPLTVNQFSALISLCYNIGHNAFRKSTLVDHLNKGDINGAANEFLRWSHTNGVTNYGLLRRRMAEKALFLL